MPGVAGNQPGAVVQGIACISPGLALDVMPDVPGMTCWPSMVTADTMPGVAGLQADAMMPGISCVSNGISPDVMPGVPGAQPGVVR